VKIALVLMMTLSFHSFAQGFSLKEYNWNLTDITKKGFTKETLFSRMDRKFINLKSSICSNRALMWAHDLKRHYDIDSAKIFLFYTKTTGELGSKTWWYHVAPVVNEKGALWVIDAGFPGKIKGPVETSKWLFSFAGSKNCKEIKSGENELIARMFYSTPFPESTVYGRYDCYYRIAPGTYWTPATVAQNLLGRDVEGRPVQHERHEVDMDELYQSCLEATTNKFEYVLGAGVEKCKKYTGRD
jgi:hypothetical protein